MRRSRWWTHVPTIRTPLTYSRGAASPGPEPASSFDQRPVPDFERGVAIPSVRFVSDLGGWHRLPRRQRQDSQTHRMGHRSERSEIAWDEQWEKLRRYFYASTVPTSRPPVSKVELVFKLVYGGLAFWPAKPVWMRRPHAEGVLGALTAMILLHFGL